MRAALHQAALHARRTSLGRSTCSPHFTRMPSRFGMPRRDCGTTANLCLPLNSVALRHAEAELRKDHDMVLDAAMLAGEALAYVAAELQNESDIVLTAVGQDGRAMEFAAAELRDKEVEW